MPHTRAILETLCCQASYYLLGLTIGDLEGLGARENDEFISHQVLDSFAHTRIISPLTIYRNFSCRRRSTCHSSLPSNLNVVRLTQVSGSKLGSIIYAQYIGNEMDTEESKTVVTIVAATEGT